MKTNIAIFFLFLGIIFCRAKNLYAANWYVDNSAIGVNNGSSWQDAWQSFSAINWGNVQPGDTINISGGTTSKIYTEAWNVGKSGTPGNPITIRPGVDNGHDGMVIFDYDELGDSATSYAIGVANRSNLIFNGVVDGEKHLMIRNLRNIHNRAEAYGIAGWSLSNIIIDNVIFDNVNTPVRLWNATGLVVSHSQFLKVRGDAAVAFLSTTGTWDTNLIYDNYIELSFNETEPPDETYPYAGPDGIQSGDGVSIYNNTIKVVPVAFYTSSQHPDSIQQVGTHVKIFGNEFINIGDSAIDLAGDYVNPYFSDVMIYNNVFRITEDLDSYPEYIRLYGTPDYGIQSINNYKIYNNTFIDNIGWTSMIFKDYQGDGNPTASGNEIKNNIFYNLGRGDQWFPVWSITNSSNFDANSFTFDGNIYFNQTNTPHVVFRGTDYTAANWIVVHEPNSKVDAPVFQSYTPFSSVNNLHLVSSDTAAKNSGLDIGWEFSIDKDGVSRPQGSGWDIGAYEYVDPETDTTPPSSPYNLTVR